MTYNIINTNIENMIYEIRGKQVMLDSDLARLYQCKNGTKSINLAVKRHINRFPKRFMFQVTEEELKSLQFQLETANNKSRTLPYVFTEQGVAMLSAVLRTEVAEEISIAIMDAFVSMRHYISNNMLEHKYIKDMILKHDYDIKLLKNTFSSFDKKENTIFFDGEIYDAYSKIVDIFKLAKESLVIIDGYSDKTVLDMISDLKVNITLITKNNKLLKKLDIEKYNKQYNNLKIIFNDTFHDRYFIIDNKTIYHSGTSINQAGRRTFSINKLEDIEIINALIEKVNKIIT